MAACRVVFRGAALVALCLLVVVKCNPVGRLTDRVIQLNRQKRQVPSLVNEAPVDDAPEDCNQADIVLVLDSSGSIGTNNWPKVLDFAKQMVNAFEVGDLGIRVGVVSYGNEASIQFHLNSFVTAAEISDAIDLIPWKDQMTNTSGGIRTMYDIMFTEEKGDRQGIPNIGIVVTDGESNRDQELTVQEADKARDRGILMFAIGIGDQLNQDELVAIGNEPIGNLDYVFNVESFDALEMIEQQLVAAACEAVAACQNDADLVFIFDSSGSVGPENFDEIKKFFDTLIENVNVGPDNAKIAVVTFNDEARVEFDLNVGSENRADVRDRVDAIQYRYGTTNTADAIRMARTQVFTTEAGDSPDRANILVLVTDGGSNDFDATIDEARQARLAGITVLTVGVGSWLNMNELKEIASDPDEENVFLAADFEAIGNVRSKLKTALCNDKAECASNPCQNGGTCMDGISMYTCECPPTFAGVNCEIQCSHPSDLVIAIDSSSSITDDNYYAMQNFVKQLAMTLPYASGDHTRLGMMSFSKEPSVKFNLNSYSTKEDNMKMLSFRREGGVTNTADALAKLSDLFTAETGDRPDVPNVALFITDGHSNNRKTTYDAAVAARQAGVTILTLGVNVNNPYDIMELKGIASDPDEMHALFAPNFTSILNLKENVVNTVCNEIDECASNPCRGDGSVCIDKMNMYECQCGSGRTGINCERTCDGRADMVFMVDTSGSIRRTRFDMLKDFLKKILSEMEIRSDRTRIGLLTFSDDPVIQFQLNSYSSKEDVLQAVSMLEFTGGRTNIAAALALMRDTMFKEDNGDRFDVPNYGILITDGQATVDRERTLPEAIEARVAGIHLIAVGPEMSQSSLELKGIASDPDEFNIFTVDRYDEMMTISNTVMMASCDLVDECTSSPCRNGAQCFNGLNQFVCRCTDRFTGPTCARECTARKDVALVVDSSGSVESMVDMSIVMAKRIVQGLNFEGGRTRVGVVTYSDSAEVRFHLNTYMERDSVMNAIAFLQTPGRTNTPEALSLTRQDVFSSANGDRSGDENILILFTDGFSNINADQTVREAESLKNQGVRLLVVGTGKRTNIQEINSMATSPESQNTFYVEDLAGVEDTVALILDELCN